MFELHFNGICKNTKLITLTVITLSVSAMYFTNVTSVPQFGSDCPVEKQFILLSSSLSGKPLGGTGKQVRIKRFELHFNKFELQSICMVGLSGIVSQRSAW